MELEGINAFRVSLERFKTDVVDNSNAVKKKVGFGIYVRAVRRSPVDTGYFRLGWNMTLNAPDRTRKGERDQTVTYPTPDLRSAYSKIANVGVDDDIFICNSVEYGIYLEAGSSKQAPTGVLGLSILDELEAFRRSGLLTIRTFTAEAV